MKHRINYSDPRNKSYDIEHYVRITHREIFSDRGFSEAYNCASESETSSFAEARCLSDAIEFLKIPSDKIISVKINCGKKRYLNGH